MKPKIDKHATYFNMLEALEDKGCFICFLCRKVTVGYLDNFLYERVNDARTKEDLKASFGFCNAHSWQIVRMQDALSTAMAYKYVIKCLITDIAHWDSQISIKFLSQLCAKVFPEKITEDFLNKYRKCPACRQYLKYEQLYLESFWEYFTDTKFQDAYMNSFGLCFVHFLKAIKLCRNGRLLKRLVKAEREKFKNLSGELSEFIRKYDYRFKNEKYGSEADSWVRTVEKIVGKEYTVTE